MTTMAMSLAMKRPAEDPLLDVPYHHGDQTTPSAIPASPIRLLSEVGPPRGAKRRKDDFPNFIRPSANIYAEDDEDDTGVDLDASYTAPPSMAPGFPCIWLNGSSPTRQPEEEDKEPEPVEPAPKPVEKPPTPPPAPVAVDTLPKGTVIIQPSQPSAEDLAPASAPLPQTPDLYKGTAGLLQFTSSMAGNHGNMPGNHGNMPGNHGNTPMARTKQEASSDLDMTPGNTDADGNTMEVCPECHKVFKRKVYLQRHMEREHWSTAKVFKCEDCAYETKHQSNLSVHRRTHTGERPYHCGACGQRYTQGHLLKSHIRSRHGGNMELYNLDKKSESTRGRKSLDMKHESLLGLAGPGPHKQDKISALLQAAAAGGAAGAMGQGGPLQQLPKFGGGLLNAPYMNSLSYFNSLRPMMGNPLSAMPGGLLGSPRLFNFGPAAGLPGPNGSFPGQVPSSYMASLNPSSLLNAHSPLHGGVSTSPSSASDCLKKTIEAMDMKPKINILNSPTRNNNNNHLGMAASKLHPDAPKLMPEGLKVESSLQLPAQPKAPQLSPQDLTTKKCPAEADVPEQLQKPAAHTEPQDLSSTPRHLATSGASPARPQESANIPLAYNHKKLGSFPPLRNHTPELDFPSTDEDDTMSTADDVHRNHGCGDGPCPHLQKLKDLRRNVFRMLSVFTPDLSFENGISSETDDVDELLYEVIYTNIEEEGGHGAHKE